MTIDYSSARSGVVYAIQRGLGIVPSAIKFGFTTGNVFERLKALQTGSADRLFPCSFTFGDEKLESEIHAHFDDFHMHGEWFFPAKKVLAAARDLEGFVLTLTRQFAGLECLQRGYALEGEIKRTDELSRDEANAVVAGLDRNRTKAQNHLYELRYILEAVEPIWDAHPHWTFGQCCDVLLNKASAA